MNLGDAVLTLRVDDQGLTSGLNKAKGEAEGLQVGVKNLVGAFATFEGVKQVVKFLSDCLDSFIEAEYAAARLSSALRATGQEYTEAGKRLMAYAGELQGMSVYNDEAIAGAETMLIQLSNLTEAGVRKALPAVMDLAAAMGMDLQNAATLVAKALEGNVGALSRYGIKIEENADPSKQFDLVIQALTEHFGGMAKAIGDTTGGQLEKFKNQVDDAKESVGGLVGYFVKGFSDWAKNFVGGLNMVWQGLKDVWDVWTDITNLRNPFGADGTLAIHNRAEYVAELSKEMRIFEGLQDSGTKMTNDEIPVIEKSTDAVEEKTKAWEYLGTATSDYYDSAIKLNETMRAIWDDEQRYAKAVEDSAVAISAASTATRGYSQEQQLLMGLLDDTPPHFASMDTSVKILAGNLSSLGSDAQATFDYMVKHGKDVADSLKASLDIVGGAFRDVFVSVGKDLAAGTLTWASFATAAVKALGKIISAMGDQLAASAAADLVIAIADLASVVLAPAAPGYFASSAIKAGGAAAAWMAGAALENVSFAQGADFVVPPGYPDDSFPMRVQSGEHVSVTPAGEGGDMIHNTMIIDGAILADWFTKASRNGRILTRARSVVP